MSHIDSGARTVIERRLLIWWFAIPVARREVLTNQNAKWMTITSGGPATNLG
jgi:hypothetical protein